MLLIKNTSIKKTDLLAFFLIFFLIILFYSLKFLFIPNLFKYSEFNIGILSFSLNNLSSIFSIITIFIFFIGIFSSWNYLIKKLSFKFIFSLVLFLISTLAAFNASNLLTFYFFFELTSLPIIYFLFLFGKRQRKFKALKLYLSFTLLGSILIFIALLLVKNFFVESLQLVITCLIIAFFIKIPIFPFYLWLPEAHVESPTIGSIFLAGIILKLGGFGFLKFVFPLILIYNLNFFFLPILITVSIISIIFSCISALIVHDLKKIIAYSSVAHMGIIFLNMIMPVNSFSTGNFIGMISHSLTASTLFLIAGILYEKTGTRNILYFTGLSIQMPILAVFMFSAFLSNISFPFTLGFISELIIFISIGSYSNSLLIIIFLANLLIILFSFKFIKIFYFGNLNIWSNYNIKDISRRNFYLLLLLAIPQFFFGFFPYILINIISIF
jgi:NADH:ubiquinone oxidoreductase subunit 4 (subunit M)